MRTINPILYHARMQTRVAVSAGSVRTIRDEHEARAVAKAILASPDVAGRRWASDDPTAREDALVAALLSGRLRIAPLANLERA